MTWSAPESDLRTLLSDNAEDKYRYRKKVFGNTDGTNVRFKTFEFRRVTDFTSGAYPLGVWVEGVLLAATDIASDNPTSGDFELDAAPTVRQKVEASYYIQWFLDSEIQNFLRLASNWLGMGDDYIQISPQLRPSALKYASAEAYQKLSLRWAEHLSEGFLLNDAPVEKDFAPVEKYRELSLDLRKEAEEAAKFVYSRSAQNYQPLWGFALGSDYNEPQPRR